MIETMAKIQAAVRAARVRTGDGALAVSVRAGQFRAERVTFDARGRADVRAITGWISLHAVLAALAKM